MQTIKSGADAVLTIASTAYRESQFSDSLIFRRASSIYSSELDTSYSTRALDASHSTLIDASSYLGRSCSERDAPDLNLLDTHLRQLNCQEKPSDGKEGHHYGVVDSQLELDILNERDSGDWLSPGTTLGAADPSTFDYFASDERSSLPVDIPLELSDQVNSKRRSSLQNIKSGLDETRQSFTTVKSIEFSLGDLDLESFGSFHDLEHGSQDETFANDVTGSSRPVDPGPLLPLAGDKKSSKSTPPIYPINDDQSDEPMDEDALALLIRVRTQRTDLLGDKKSSKSSRKKNNRKNSKIKSPLLADADEDSSFDE
ncbi:hypothetical protein THAOC_30482, partial [Thalassiosira oceanica]